MARHLADAGHDVQMITAWRESQPRSAGRWHSERLDGITVHWFHQPYSNHLGFYARLYAFFAFAIFAERKAIALGGDLVFATSTPLTIAIPGVRAARALGVPMVFEVRDLWPDLPIAMGILRNRVAIALARQLERYAYRNSKRLIALSPGMARGVAAAGYAEEHITVIPNTCNNALFGSAPAEASRFLDRWPQFRDHPLIVYTGAIGPANGVAYLVRLAAAMLGINDSVRFLITGDGKERQQIEKLAANLGVLDRNLWIADPIPKADVPGMLGAATMAASLLINVPAMAHSSPNKLFDALAAGTPVLINWPGWLAEILAEHGAGLFVPPDQPEEAARILNTFLTDKGRLEKAAQMARHLARERFDKDQLATRLRAVLEEAALS